MIRYTRQYDSFRCVPVAVLNVLKWLKYKEFDGHPVNYKLAKTLLSNLCETNEHGSVLRYAIKILRALPELQICPYQDIRKLPPSLLVQPDKRICLVQYQYIEQNQDILHVSLLMYYYNSYYTALNWVQDQTWSQIHEREIHMSENKVVGYLLTKKEI